MACFICHTFAVLEGVYPQGCNAMIKVPSIDSLHLVMPTLVLNKCGGVCFFSFIRSAKCTKEIYLNGFAFYLRD